MVTICYFCQTPITEESTEYRGEPVHAKCELELQFIESLRERELV